MRCTALLLCFVAATATGKDLFRCTTSSGGIEYQDAPCAPGTGGRLNIRSDTPTIADEVAANRALQELKAESREIDRRIEARLMAAREARAADAREQRHAERLAAIAEAVPPPAPEPFYLPYVVPVYRDPPRHHHATPPPPPVPPKEKRK